MDAGGEALAFATNDFGLTAMHCAADANRAAVVEALAARLERECEKGGGRRGERERERAGAPRTHRRLLAIVSLTGEAKHQTALREGAVINIKLE